MCALHFGGLCLVEQPKDDKHQTDNGEDVPKLQTLTVQTQTAPVVLALPDNLQDFLDAQERDILCRVLHDTRYNRTAAASKLGMSLRQIRYRIARLNIAMPDSDTHEASHDISDEPA